MSNPDPAALLRTAFLLPLAVLVACSDGSDRRPVTEDPSTLTVMPVAFPEGGPGEMPRLPFRVTLDMPQSTDVLLRYETAAATATAGIDYLDAAGEVLIPAGALEASFSVELIGDAEEETAETFRLLLSVEGLGGLLLCITDEFHAGGEL